jgi:hypothetical protein
MPRPRKPPTAARTLIADAEAASFGRATTFEAGDAKSNVGGGTRDHVAGHGRSQDKTVARSARGLALLPLVEQLQRHSRSTSRPPNVYRRSSPSWLSLPLPTMPVSAGRARRSVNRSSIAGSGRLRERSLSDCAGPELRRILTPVAPGERLLRRARVRVEASPLS